MPRCHAYSPTAIGTPTISARAAATLIGCSAGPETVTPTETATAATAATVNPASTSRRDSCCTGTRSATGATALMS